MNFAPTVLTPEEECLRQEVREFLATELEPTYRPNPGMHSGWDLEFSRKLAKRGWVGMAIPPEYGGHGRSAVERFIVIEELLAAGAPVRAHYIGDRQTAPHLMRFGSEALCRRFLPLISSAECSFAIGMSEPDAGSDLASVRTSATAVEGGWRLNGAKTWTTSAHEADFLTVLCRTSPLEHDRHAGLSQLIVGLDSPGLAVNPISFIDGSQHINEVVLNDVFVPDEMVLGEVGDGWRQVTSELAHERAGPDRYMSTFNLLRQFLATEMDVPPSDSQAVAVGRITAWFWTIRQLSLSVARSLDAGRVPALEAALLKDLGTSFEQEVIEVLRYVADMEIDPESGVLFTQLLAEAVLIGPCFTIVGGTTEIMRSIVAKGL